MKRAIHIVVVSLLLSSVAFADDDDDYDNYRNGQDFYPSNRQDIVYVPERVVEYVPAQPQYYAPPPPPVQYYGYDQRSPQGLLGGMLGSVLGYEMGGGNPLAAGIGAAAGAWMGNGMY